MAIGSNPEIGIGFTTWGQMNNLQRDAWFTHMRNVWGNDLAGGYGHVCWPDMSKVEENDGVSVPILET